LEAPVLHTLRLIAPQRDVIASLACVRLTGWPVAWNWRRAVLSADAGLLVKIGWHLSKAKVEWHLFPDMVQ